MHEMSIAMNLLELAEEAAAHAGCSKIMGITVQYGQISGIMPDALLMAFEALTSSGIHSGARLTLEKVPLRLRCVLCGALFTMENYYPSAPCPMCGEIFGHNIEAGKELILARIEAVPAERE